MITVEDYLRDCAVEDTLPRALYSHRTVLVIVFVIVFIEGGLFTEDYVHYCVHRTDCIWGAWGITAGESRLENMPNALLLQACRFHFQCLPCLQS